MKIVFMGTPDFSVPTLEALIRSRHQVVGVITQPDKPRGRGKEMQFPPVKEKALEHRLNVYQPAKVREQSFIEVLKEINPDVIVVVAFGQILSKAVLEIPKYGCINVHASLLPKYRGAAPIQWAVINGEEKSGVTIMQMDAGIDTGDMLLQKEIILDKKETGGSLFEKLSLMGGELVLEALQLAEEGKLKPVKQEENLATKVTVLSKSMGKIDFTRPAEEIERFIRGLNPWPSAFTHLDGKTLKIWDADVTVGESSKVPGEVIGVAKDSFVIQTGREALAVKELQLEGKKRMSAKDFLRGYNITTGMILKGD